MLPAVGARSPDNRLIKVVFPAPLGPITACTTPLVSSIETLLTAVRPPNTLVSPTALRPRSLILEIARTGFGPANRRCRPGRWAAEERSEGSQHPFRVASVLPPCRAAPDCS